MEGMHRYHSTRVRLYPTPDQEASFVRISGCCRLVYNLGLEQRRDHWHRFRARTGAHISWYSQKREIKALKEAAPFFSEVPIHCLQQALAHLNTAYDRFFKGVSGYPKPRKRFAHDRFTFPDPAQIGIDFGAGVLRLPKFKGTGRKDDNGVIRARFHRPLRGELRSITVSRSGRHWYASILMRVKVGTPRARVPCENGVGLDRGVTHLVALSNGVMLGGGVETARVRAGEEIGPCDRSCPEGLGQPAQGQRAVGRAQSQANPPAGGYDP